MKFNDNLPADLDSLPVIEVSRFGLKEVEVRVPGSGSSSIAMVMRLAADAIETLGAMNIACVPVVVMGSDHILVRLFIALATYDRMEEAVHAVRDAAIRESVVKTARYPVAQITHRVRVT